MLKIGADPEVFAKQAGVYLSAHGMIPGTKKHPYRVENGAVQVDGMALEFNINPATQEQEFIYNINSVMEQLRAMVPDVELAADPVARFTREYMAQQPDEALELGCDPDFNAWTGQRNEQPHREEPICTGAGHVHLGWIDGDIPEGHREVCEMVTRQLDFYLGLPSVLYDTETLRRTLYGKAGAYRVKPYGVEYRTLSNRWLISDDLKGWVFRNTQAAFESLKYGELRVEYGDIQAIINESLVGDARDILNREGIELPRGVRHVG